MIKISDLSVGSKVRCISDKGWDGVFTEGEQYTVTKIWDGTFSGVHLDGEPAASIFLDDFELVEVVAQKVATEKAVDTKLPVKVVYAVLNKYNEILATTADREYARELKTALGGKRNGVVIYQFKANKEIR